MNDLSAVESIFFAALAKGSPAERATYLDEACGRDPELRGCVERLLQAHPQMGDFLQAPAAEPVVTVDEPPLAEKPGTLIGPYKLLQQIGEGGMGVVYMAEQEQPVRRKVALKIIKPGMDSRQVIARFEAERQALALMDHQNIARVLDAGTTDSGRPYFVMELVHGVPLTRYCDENRLTPRQRLELFIPVCHAIQHAHQKGIIHRDVKPSNVLVTMYDDRPVPKVIDFGVAKAVEQRLTEKTLFTQYGTLVGTFEYMSPEQAEMNAFGVDTRSDIYALGVLLYELLTGSTPLSRERLKEAAFGEIVRLIKEEETPRPSTRLSTSGAALAAVAQQRGTEPAQLARLVKGELDWIVMRCLEKDRTRRYETANGLARDVQRYLHDEPVEACPPSAGYRLRKAARKHKRPLAVAAAFGVLLLAGFGLVTWKWQDERAARAEADAARQDALSKARELQDASERMNAANAAMDLGDYHVNFYLWADADAEYTKATALRKDHSSVWMRRARFYARLGLWDLVAADWKQAFELREPDASIDWFVHALLLLEAGDAEGYRRLCLRMRDRFGASTDGFEVWNLINTLTLVADAPADWSELVPLAERVQRAKGFHAVPAYFFGILHYRAGRFEEAVRHHRQSLADSTWAWRAINYPTLAMALHQLGQHEAARQELENTRKTLDQWAQEAFPARGKFVPVAYWWDWVWCQRFYREAHTLIEGSPPPEDPRLRVVRGRAFAALGRPDQASAEFARAARLAPDDAPIRSACFHFHVANQRWREAETELDALVRLRPDDPKVHLDAFRAYADMKQWDKATAAHMEAVRLRPDDILIRLERFRYYADRGETVEADKACAEVASSRENDVAFRIRLGDACAELQQWSQARAQYAKAIDLGTTDGNIWFRHAVLQLYLGDQEGYRRTYASLMDRHGTDPDPRTAHMLTLVGYLAADPGVDPARVVRMGEILAKADRPHGEARLGIALVRAGRYDEAVPLLTSALSRYSWPRIKIALALAEYQRGEVENARHLMGQVPAGYRQLNLTGASRMWADALETKLLYRDAEAILQTERWREVCNLVKTQQLAEADRVMKKLLPAEPKHAPELIVRGLYHVERGQWDQAARDYGEAVRRGADSPGGHWATHALLCRLASQPDEHRRVCAAMRERFGKTEDPWTAFIVVQTCQHALGPGERDRLLLVVEKNPDLLGVRGGLLYRQGQFEAAARRLEEVLKKSIWLRSQFDKLYLAMAYQRLGREEQARTLLAEASSWIAQNASSIPWFGARQELKMLRVEAEELILRKPASPGP